MSHLDRRSFMHATAAGTLAAAPLAGPVQQAAAARGVEATPLGSRVDFIVDGVPLDAVDYATVLRQQCSAATARDEYANGGAVEDLEKQFATLLGKEVAVFMPSGTLANHLAVRTLAGPRHRVIVQEVSHLYNDSGDCAQQLSNLTLVPLAAGRGTFGWDDVSDVIQRAASGRVPMSVGAVSIESPIRRLRNEVFDFATMQRVSREARRLGIGLHLDGARLFVAAAYSGRDPAEYAALFDTVYVSLWKTFNSANGAILAGPKALLKDLFHVRRMFGGNMHQAWPDAVVASYYAKGYLERMRAAVAVVERTLTRLESDRRFVVERVENGTSLVRLRIPGRDPVAFRKRLAAASIDVNPPDGDGIWLRVNETAARMSGDSLGNAFLAALVD